MRKCKKCGAPLEGFLYNTLGKLLGIQPSKADPEVCNKCMPEDTQPEVSSQENVAAPMPEISDSEANNNDVGVGENQDRQNLETLESKEPPAVS